MSFQRPIFDKGLYGKANREFLNGLSDAADMVHQFSEPMRWADMAMRKFDNDIRWFLGIVRYATPMDGEVNRWVYRGYAVTFDVGQGEAAAVNWERVYADQDEGDAFDDFTGAFNLREMFNTSTWVDGIDATTVDVGPAGSFVIAGDFATDDLRCITMIGTYVDKNGKPIYFFSAPNAMKCVQ